MHNLYLRHRHEYTRGIFSVYNLTKNTTLNVFYVVQYYQAISLKNKFFPPRYVSVLLIGVLFFSSHV